MAKQIYIDENGNEVLVSGTITNAGNLPLGSDFSDPTSTAGAIKANTDNIGDLTSLTTTNKSSAVGAINEVNAKFKTEKVTFSKAVASGNNAFSVAPAHKPSGYVIVAATVDTSDTGIAGATNRFTVALFSNAEAWVYITANSARTINGSVLFVYAKSFDFT